MRKIILHLIKKIHATRYTLTATRYTLHANLLHATRYTLLAVLFLLGCATPEQPTWDPFKLVWPLPPESPRIKYVDTLRGEEDVKGDSITRFLLGKEETVNLVKPYGVTTDEQGRVYVSDIGRVFVFDKANKTVKFIGTEPPRRLVRPLGMSFDKKNKLLYVADSIIDRIMVFRPDGHVVMEIGQAGELKDPGGVAVDPVKNRVYVANTKKHVITVFDTEGRFIKNIGERGSKPGQFNFPTQVALDKDGNIYVIDLGNFRVQLLDPEGKYIRHFGEAGDFFGQFATPKGIALDPEGHIYVTDARFHGVTIFDKEGTLLLGWGTRGFLKGLFELPAGIHIDEKGLIYVVSQWTAKVDIFQYISYPESK